MNTSPKLVCSTLLAASLGLLAAGAWAQETGSQDPSSPRSMAQEHEGMQHQDMQDQGMRGMENMEGRHSMPATVTSVDKSTGLVEVTAGGMSLRVHFPPASLADLNEGDKIVLHLAFSKAE